MQNNNPLPTANPEWGFWGKRPQRLRCADGLGRDEQTACRAL
jgi:hypothetical protein